MDLKELQRSQINRHPWESSRLKALRDLLHPHLFEGIRVLDVGCGDGFISRNLFSHIEQKQVTAVDTHLSNEQILWLNEQSSGISHQKNLPEQGEYDLILLLDILEHVEDDHLFLANIVNTFTSSKTKVMITIPAFQSIFGHHDVFLGHYRRYRLQDLIRLAMSSGLCVRSSGYLFSCLLLPKYVFYKLLNTEKGVEGVGNWKRGKVLTRMLEFLFDLDNRLLISASRLGIKIPGLTGWVLCERKECRGT